MANTEVFYLIFKFLEASECKDGAEAIKRFMLENSTLPCRMNCNGQSFSNSFENIDSIYRNIDADSLSLICKQFLTLTSANKSNCAKSLSSLLDVLSLEKKHKLTWTNTFESFYTSAECVSPCSSFSKTLRCQPNMFMPKYIQHVYRKIALRRHVLAHRSVIYCLKYDHRSEYLVSASDDYTIKIWSLHSDTDNLDAPLLRHTLRGHLAEIIDIDISIDNHLLVSVDADCSLVIWCLRTGQTLVSFKGSRINRVVCGLSFIPIVQNPSSDMNECSDLLLVCSYGGGLHFIPYIHQTHQNERKNMNCCSIELKPTITFNEYETGEPTTSVVFDVSPGGKFVAVGCSDARVRLISISKTGFPTVETVLSNHQDSVNSVAFSHSGVQLASASADDGTCSLWSIKEGLWTIDFELKLKKRPKCRPCILRWSINDRYLIVCMKSGSVYLFYGKTGEIANILEGHEGAVYAVATSPFDEEILATGGADGRFYIWHVACHHWTGHRKESPVLFFYRFPAPQNETDLGVTWQQPLDVRVGESRSVPQMLFLDGNDSGADEPTVRLIGIGGTSTAPTAMMPSPQTQRITCCVAMPQCDGPGFLVATKAGVISLFAPVIGEEDAGRIFDQPPPYEEQFLHWEMDAAELHEVLSPANLPDLQSQAVALALGAPISPQSLVNPPRLNPLPLPSPGDALNYYQPPPGVLFKLVHAPSQVPFGRLPPAYLTTLRGCVYPPKRQAQQIPGRGGSDLKSVDLKPTLAFDEDGEEVVVDDIQFCTNVPATYCYPTPVQSRKPRLADKTYLWQSYWLSGQAELIRPLSAMELSLAYEMHKLLHEFEAEKAEFRPCSPVTDNLQDLVDGADSPIVIGDDVTMISAPPPSTLNQPLTVGTNAVPDNLNGGPLTSPLDEEVGPSTDPDFDPGVADLVVEEEEDESSGEDWDAGEDVDIGWWQRRHQRSQQQRRRAAMTTSRRNNSSVELIFVDRNAEREQTDRSSRQTYRRRSRNWRSTTEVANPVLTSLRRSTRQRRRQVLRRQAVQLQRASSAAARATHLEAVRTLKRARRSERLRRFLVASSDTQAEEEREAGLAATSFDAHRARREHFKQTLVRFMDYVDAHHVALPLMNPPLLDNPSLNPPFNRDSAWPGPSLDWLSSLSPAASPYVPQLGDRLVYIVRGHREYLHTAWQDGKVPSLEDPPVKTRLNSGGQAGINSKDVLLPWEQQESNLPGYICCRVVEVAYHFVRVTCGVDQRSKKLNRSSVTADEPPPRQRRRNSLRSSMSVPPSSSTTMSSTINLPTVPSTDSFVRLVTLRLTVEAQQPYLGLNGQQSPPPPQQQETSADAKLSDLFVRYHDVDGVLDFLVLRHVFDEAITRSWNTGDVFVCPVDDIWWRGRVLSPFPRYPVHSEDLLTSTAAVNTPTRDPWLGVRVRWLENQEFGTPQEPLIPPSLRGFRSNQAGVEALGVGRFRGDPQAGAAVEVVDRSPGKPLATTSASADVVITYSDQLSPWDMHVWTHRLPVIDSATRSSFAMLSSDIHLPYDRLVRLFGSQYDIGEDIPSTSSNTHTSSLTPLSVMMDRMRSLIEKLMSLGASEVFNVPVDLASYPNYLLVNPYLVDFNFIKLRLINQFYRHTDALRFDIEQIYMNALRYNEPGSLIVCQSRLVTSLALKALSDPDYSENQLVEEYSKAILTDPLLDPCMEVKSCGSENQSSSDQSSSTLPITEVHSPKRSTNAAQMPNLKRLRTSHPSNSSSRRMFQRSSTSPVILPPRRPNFGAITDGCLHRHLRTSPTISSSDTSGIHSRLRRLTFPSRHSTSSLGDSDNETPPDWRKSCRKLLVELKRQPRSLYFREPVDVYQYPTYAEAVSDPVDLSLIQQRLAVQRPSEDLSSSRHYSKAEDFLSDLELIVNNSRAFNRSNDTQVYWDTRWLSRWIRCVATPRVRNFLDARIDSHWALRRSPSMAPVSSERLQRIEPIRLRLPSNSFQHISEGQVTSTPLLSRKRKRRRRRHPSRTTTSYFPHDPFPSKIQSNGREHAMVRPEAVQTVTLSSGEELEEVAVEDEQPDACLRTSRGRISRPPVRSDGSVVRRLSARSSKPGRLPSYPLAPQPPPSIVSFGNTERPRRSLASARHYFEDIEDAIDEDDDDDDNNNITFNE